ncbi:MAG: hypothetical protein ACLFRY_07000 [Spirochaetia bacterium]
MSLLVSCGTGAGELFHRLDREGEPETVRVRLKYTEEGGAVYRLIRPQKPGEGAVFFAEYSYGSPTAPAKITLTGEGGEVLEITDLPELPPSNGEARVVFEYPIPGDFILEEITAQGAPGTGSGDSAYRPLARTGFRPGGRKISFGEDTVTVAAGYGLSWTRGELAITLPKTDSSARGGEIRSYALEYEGAPPPYDPEAGAADSIRVFVGGREKERSARLTLREGDNTLFFHPSVWRGDFDTISFRGIDENFRPISFAPDDPSDSQDTPIDLDAGSILRFDQADWRREEFELFRWNLFPSILVFDTRDYGVQAGLFKRLAFFVEKRGYTGKLLSDAELEGKHGWNAHDYRAVDLAAFFQTAEDRHFELGAAEHLLRDRLLANGIIRFEGGMYLPGEGGVISVSRESSEYLRRKFMVHEGYHGAFFVSGELRDRCFEHFADRPEKERRFWTDFLALMGYGTDNRYLLVNEYQAYLLQQPVGEAEGYFRGHWAYRRLSGEEVLFGNEESPFYGAAREMERTVYELFALTAGELFCLDGFTE